MTSISRRKAGSSERVNTIELDPVGSLPGVHQIVLPTPWGGMSVEVYLLQAEPLTLIDTGVGFPASRAALQEAFSLLGLELQQVERIIITHYHTDHMGQAQAIRDAGARLEVFAHEIEVPWIEGFSRGRHLAVQRRLELFGDRGVPREILAHLAEAERYWLEQGLKLAEDTTVERPVKHGDRIAFEGFELQVIHAPGHTAGHLVLFEPGSGALFSGDHLMGADVPFTDTYYHGEVADPTDPLGRPPRFRGLPAYLSSLAYLKDINLKAILPAHGGVIRLPHRTVEASSRFYNARVRRVHAALLELYGRGSEVTAWDIWRYLYPNADPYSDLRRRMLVVIGALDVLEEQGACSSGRGDDGMLVHRPLEESAAR